MENKEKLDSSVQRLFQSAIDARLKAYCPYSKFRVGAALLCEDGSVFTGCNVENVAYSMCICAERTAIVKAVSEGRQKFKAIAISSDLVTCFTYPCGACRQFMAEFGEYDVYIVMADNKEKFEKFTVADFMPNPFRFDKKVV